jgi:hypothetical protein
MQASTTAERKDRREWRLLWLGSVQAFADSYSQRIRWSAASKTNPSFSFVDCMSSYFDEAYLSPEDAYDKRLARGDLTPAEVAAVTKFHSLAQSYESPGGHDWDSQAILRDPKWQEVVAAARDAQEQLLLLLSDSAERKALTIPLYGREQADADLVSSPLTAPGTSTLGQTVVGSGTRLFVFRKAVSPTSTNIPADVRRQLLPLGFRSEKTPGGITFRRTKFAFGRDTRMFAGFSEVRLTQESGLWVLRLKLDPVLWLVFVIPVALLLTKPISAIGKTDLWEALALPTALVGASSLWAWTRLSRWWSRL